MNWAHAHLLLNHIPVLGTLFGLALLLVAISKKSEELKKISFGVFVVIALIAIPTYLTGEPAEEIVEHLPGVSEPIIEEHEESALASLIAVEALGLFSLAGLWLCRGSRNFPRWFVTTCLILSMVAGGMVAWTSNLGRQIRHTEARAEFQPSSTTD